MKAKNLFLLFAAVLGLALAVLAVWTGVATAGPAHTAPAACVPGPHSGTITANETWCLADNPHQMTDNVTVAAGVVLTLEPGVIVQADNNGWAALVVEGHLEAVGTEVHPIIFTSEWDSGSYQWPGITFDGGTGTLRHTILRYTGRGCYGCPIFKSAGIAVFGVQAGQVTLEDSQVIDSAGGPNDNYGLMVVDSRVAVTDTLFSGIGDDPAQMDFPLYISGASSDVSLSGLRLENNVYNRVLLDMGAMTGHDFALTAQPEMDGYELYSGAAGGQFIVPAGITMTVEPGVTVMNNWDINKTLIVQGHLEAMGTEEQPVVFTSHDDSGPGQWMGITFDGGTGTLRHAIVRYAGRACYGCPGYTGAAIRVADVQTGEATIEASRVMSVTGSTSMTNQGLRVEGSRVAVTDTTFSGIGDNATQLDYPVYVSGASSDVSLSGLRLENNAYNRVLLDMGAMTGHDFTLTAQPEMDSYELYSGAAGGQFIVPAGITMTVEPGVTVMNNWDINKTLIVQGHLEAMGTEEQPIVFTSHDDSGPSQWMGITFDGGTGTLRHAIVRYAGRGSYGCPATGAAIAVAGVQAGEVTIEASQVISAGGYNEDSGLCLVDSQAVVSDTLFTAIGNNPGQDESAIRVKGNSRLSLSGIAIEDNVRHGVMVEGAAQVQVADSAIVGNGGHGVWVSGDTAVLTMSGSTVLGNTEDGVRNSGNAQVTLGGADGLGNTILGNGGKGANQVGTGTQMNATYNWWGDVTGPYNATLNPGGLGENVSDRVLFDPWAVDWQGQVPDGVYVTLVGPRQVVAGGVADYTVMYVNGRAETVENAVLVMVLPSAAFYQDATHGGAYLAQQHAVVWKLGNLAPGGSGTVAAQVMFAWGLSIDSEYAAQARLGGTNLPLSLPNPEWYAALLPVDLLGSTLLTEVELAAERTAYPDLDLLYTQAEADGFLPGGAVRLALDAAEPITQVVLLRTDSEEVMYLRRQGDQVLAATFGMESYAVRDAAGGLTLDLQTNAETFWGTWGSGETPSAAGLAYSNCRYPNIPALVLEDKLANLAQALGSATCYPCLSGGACGNCFAALQGIAPLPEAAEALACAAAGAVGDVKPLGYWFHPPVTHCPDGDWYVDCSKPWWAFNSKYHWSETIYYCVEGFVVWGQWGVFPLGPDECDEFQTCVEGVWEHGKPKTVGCQCEPVHTSPKESTSDLSLGFQPFTPVEPAVEPATDAGAWLSGCASGEEEGVSKCPRTKIRRPKDPNAKYGLAGDLVPGQLVTYTVTYENEGDGRAYGVFVVDQLDPALDLPTLTIYGPGELIAENRTILWTVGGLGPKGDPDSQGVVSFTVTLRDDLLPGTAVINQATVFFPTVGEETPTNPVVNVVQPLAAVPQRVETTYMQSVAIALAGRGAAGVPLAFQVLSEPLNGTLSGTAPDLVYTPAENTTGLDSFTFKVTGAGQESRPAEVQIVIDPAGDATLPTVVWTYPADGATGVAISAQPVFTDGVGPVWGPLPFVQFSEAMDEVTVTDGVVRMVDGTGQAVPVSVAYDGVTHRAAIYPRQALQGGMTYTVTVAAGVKDLADNPLAADHVWSFRTAEAPTRIYLPLVVRNY
jgi:uncharacterized repeat protein (TIGR01451 family)